MKSQANEFEKRSLSGMCPERINVDYRLWLQQKTENEVLKGVVIVQLFGIVILAVAVAVLMFRWW